MYAFVLPSLLLGTCATVLQPHSMLQEALKEVEQSCAAVRRATPHDMHSYMGLLHASDPSLPHHPTKAAARTAFASIAKQLAAKLVDAVTAEALLDAVADQQAASLLAARLPPAAHPPRPPPRDSLATSTRLWCALQPRSQTHKHPSRYVFSLLSMPSLQRALILIALVLFAFLFAQGGG